MADLIGSSKRLPASAVGSAHGVDLWSLRCFVAVAEELSFSRAATTLHVTQPALSRRMQHLERQIGVPLVVRTTRRVTLTPAGQALLPAAREIAADVARAVQQAQMAGQPSVAVGFTAGLSTTRAVRLFRASWPDVSVKRRRVEWNDQASAVASGRVDLCIGRLPVRAHRLEVTPLYDEARVVIMSRDHRFAGKESLGILDLSDEPMVRHPDAAEWDAFWRIDPRPDGRSAPDGPVAVSVEEKLDIVAGGEVVAILPASAAEQYVRADIVQVPLDDVAPATVVAITRTPRSPAVEGLLDAVVSALRQNDVDPDMAPVSIAASAEER